MSKKLIVALSAAVICAKMVGAAPAPYSDTVLDDLETLIETNDLTAIQNYLIENDGLITGETTLAITARMVLEDGSFKPATFNFDEAWYHSRYKARYTRNLRKRIKAFRKWRRGHIY